MDKVLNELRDLNRGANPERILKEDISQLDGDTLIDVEGHVYELTNSKSEVEYIVNNKGIYGVIYKGRYYRLM